MPQRVQSASRSRPPPSPCSFTEALSARDRVEQLQYELLNTQAEMRKVTEQLNCLILLVKKAWMGDSSAATHVARIVGVAPPDINDLEVDPDKMIANYITKPKSKALNNWALLTIGLLNQHYKELEHEVEAQQRYHLQQREVMLDRELASTASTHSVTHSAMRRPSLEQRRTSLQKNGVTFLEEERKPPPTTPVHFEPAPACQTNGWTKPNVKHLYRSPSREHIQDPYRFGLFDADTVISSDAKKRPPSGKQQRNEDRARSRPRSAVTLSSRSQRPLRNETTVQRPLSSKRRNSAGPAPRMPTEEKPKKKIERPKPPESVTEFTNDLLHMGDLEREFKQTTMDLQKKLGLNPSGLIF